MNMSSVICILLVAVASYGALMNILGVVQAFRRPKDEGGGYSCVPLWSIVFALAAWFVGPEPLGLWVFAPAVLDPGTWVLVLGVPIALFSRR